MIKTQNGRIMSLIAKYGQIPGDHHKAWVLDQIARIIMGVNYDDWVANMRGGKEGDEMYDYEIGIAP